MIEPLTRLPDGTIKQVNPITGTKVWTLPGRGARPSGLPSHHPLPIDPDDHDRHCAFCWGRMLETTPEIARLVHDGDVGTTLRGVLAERPRRHRRPVPPHPQPLRDPQLRLLAPGPRLGAHGRVPSPPHGIPLDPGGREHVTALARIRMRARGTAGADAEPLAEDDLEREAVGLFAGNHQVVIARRHYVDGATDDSQLAGSGTLTPEEHWQIHRVHDPGHARPLPRQRVRTATSRSSRTGWHRPARRSTTCTSRSSRSTSSGAQKEREVERLRTEPDLFARWGAEYAADAGSRRRAHRARGGLRRRRAPLPGPRRARDRR